MGSDEGVGAVEIVRGAHDALVNQAVSLSSSAEQVQFFGK
jgi:hypothetical protein